MHLDLNGYTITGGIVISSDLDQVSIVNGIIDANGGVGVQAQSNSSNITLEKLTIKNGTDGINFDGVHDAQIANCVFAHNDTGVSINNSYNVAIEQSTAQANTQRGFSLVISSTCCVLDCKAVATGLNNTTAFNNNVFGFVADSSYGTIFERCIANATQALSTTDQNSLIAGFALLGTGIQCNKIIGCEAANATASTEGETSAYGIFIENRIINPIMQIALPNPVPTSFVFSVNWSPDGMFLAAGISGGDAQVIRVYAFNPSAQTLNQVATPNPIPGATTNSVNWSPNGRFLAAGISSGDAQRIRVYAFDPIAQTLIQVATPNVIPGASVNSVNWSPDGRFLAAGISSGDAQLIRVYEFDPSAQTLIQVATPNVTPGASVNSVNWSPDGRFLAAGISSGDAQLIRVYEFDPSAQTLIQVATPNVIPGNSVLEVNWSPDGRFLAAGISSGDAQRIRVYAFDPIAQTLIQVATPNPIPMSTVNSVNWSPDGRFLAAGIFSTDTQLIRVYEFDPSAQTLIQVATPNVIPSSFVSSVNWSSDGSFLATGNSSDSYRIRIYNILDFPLKNIITNNTVYCNHHDVNATYTGSVGVGISGSSIGNLIIQNSSYNHPFNYVFVQNEFNPIASDEPTLLQNLGLVGCAPIGQPDDIVTLIKRVELLSQSLVDNLL